MARERVVTYLDTDLLAAFKNALDGVPMALGLRRMVEEYVKRKEQEAKK